MGFCLQRFLWLRTAGSRHTGAGGYSGRGLRAVACSGFSSCNTGAGRLRLAGPTASASAAAAGGPSSCGACAYCSAARETSPGPPLTGWLLIRCATREVLFCSVFKSSCLLIEWQVFFVYSKCESVIGDVFCKHFLPICGFSFSLQCFHGAQIFLILMRSSLLF